MTRHGAAIGLWVLAWFCAGVAAASIFAARNGKRAVARAGFTAGLAGAAGFAWAGVALW